MTEPEYQPFIDYINDIFSYRKVTLQRDDIKGKDAEDIFSKTVWAKRLKQHIKVKKIS